MKTNIIKLIFTTCLLLISNYAFASNTNQILEAINGGSINDRVIYLFLIITFFSLAPSILIMGTSFVRISIALSILRSALGLQQSPSNQVIISLALFLTLFIMTPAMEDAYENGIKPMMENKISHEEGFVTAVAPFKKFMLANTRAKDIDLFASMAKENVDKNSEDIALKILIPSFMISELRKAFEIGFLVFLPFLVIDITVSSILMAMGMMMMPPVMIALPFKIIFFVIIDGWYLISGSLVKSFIQ